MIVGRSELAAAAIVGNDPALIIFILSDQAGVDELSHETGCIVADLVVVFHLGKPQLQRVELVELGLCVGLLLCSGFLVGFDLLESSSALRGDLKHVRRLTLCR